MTAPPPPLTGVRVLDLTTFLSGPYATQILADLGADVVKVEPPAGDSSRAIPPHFVDRDSAYYLGVNRNKRSVVANLKTPDGVQLLGELARVADVVIENYRPGVLARLGLTYHELRPHNPGVVWCSISGFGQDGPYRDRPAYDMIVQAMSGGMSLTGLPDGPPVRSGIPLGDLAAGMYAVIGIGAALHQRAQTGVGRALDISMLDCQISMLSYQGAYHLLAGVTPGRQGRGHDSIPTYRAFTAADGVDLVVTANTDGMWRALCGVLDRAELLDDPRFADAAGRQAHRAELEPLLEKSFTTRPAAEWLDRLHAAAVPAAPVHTVPEALADPHVRHRDMVVDLPADGDLPALQLLGNPVKFTDGGREAAPARPPRLGEHAAEVLRDWLGTGNVGEGEAS
ncbi:CaiB/BaiF CoA transferase family protein [Phytoactinopolyspora limicola]|uniref:CaiB/BaiF CoA transferase family protein n=1 Tax=Phytoactinopolyspora limicola TaxID=2715536 RepID=UPI00140A48C9|nr:CoA transferase [Phytoactinopolyspora limicola]